MVMLLIQHNTFFNISDHLCPLIRNEFKGSQVAQSFSCSRTKTAAIVNCLGDHFFEELKSNMQEMPYSLMLDGSNANGIQKMFPITVRIFDVNFSRIMTKFLDMNLLEGRDASTADVMFESVDNFLSENDIRWDHCMAIGLDNTNVNIGDHNSIKSRAKEKNEDIVIAGCLCHILHNASGKAATTFSEVTGFDVEDHCVDVFYWFDKSGKRKSILEEYYEFCDTEYEGVIKFISTRWLCLELCINRELKTSLPCFTNFNKFLQREDPVIYQLYDLQQHFMHKLASKFIKPEIIQKQKLENKSFADLDVSLENQKDDMSLGIGPLTRHTLKRLLEEGEIDQTEVDQFFDAVRAFFVKAYEYCVQWLPLDDLFMKHCIFVDFKRRTEVSFAHIEQTITHFKRIHETLMSDPSILNAVEDEFIDYQAMNENDIPQTIWEAAVVGDIRDNQHCMDIIWGYLKPKLQRLLCQFLSFLTATLVKRGCSPLFERTKLTFARGFSWEGH
ncbi:ATP-dependent DNA helicase [Paramuricea clavata]|uniref:ATP-dependent DNA helicase n=1 Tax=Paramuricea clavata TaxID=317549 RepID=A0A7D9EJH9_PARCT|nr:ATP-dependent DNA helicase [Paramuricea clavata]